MVQAAPDSPERQPEPRLHPSASTPEYDYIVVGSGFGGSVSALRLAEKGYRVLVIEMGKRYGADDFPKTSWNLRRFLWLPALFCYGIQRLTLLRDMLVLSGAGVGGGSLVYANTLLKPPPEAFRRGNWPPGTDWESILSPHYETARRILGVTRNPHLWAGDEWLLEYARSLGREETFHRTDVGVLFGEEPGEAVGDPYFDGAGPERATCIYCGGCMVGCRHGAKNTLDKNYLHFAEALGAEVLPETRVRLVAPDPAGGYRVAVERSTRKLFKQRRELRARGVVLAAGALGTVRLLLECRERGTLPDLSPALGRYVRTNSEVIAGSTARDDRIDYSRGIAIASGFTTSEDTYLEVVRYPEGSDAMGLLATLLTPDGSRLTRPLKWLGQCLRHPLDFLRSLNPVGWARRSSILLVMQSLDSSLRMRLRRRWLAPWRKRLTTATDPGQPSVPAFIPDANRAAERMARETDGFPSTAINEVFNVPTTAHILGGASMGPDPETGVIDAGNQVWGYPGLYVVDGSMIPANLGVNPSLTITAMAEHAMSRIPRRTPGEELRPLPRRMRAAAPRTPAPETEATAVAAGVGAGRSRRP